MGHEVTAVLLVVGLFLLGVVSPGPNFFVLFEHSLAAGFRAGVVTGLGMAAGDGLYAAGGLLGLATLVARVGWLFAVVKLLGGLYIAWIGLRLMWRPRPLPAPHPGGPSSPTTLRRCFRRGLLTDLANPKTVVFFASIFATAYDPALPAWVGAGMWGGIVVTSVVWRVGIAAAFSRPAMRVLYRRAHRPLEVGVGGILAVIGVRLAIPDR